MKRLKIANSAGSESGRITLLMVALVALIGLLIAGYTVMASLHIQRQNLQAQADLGLIYVLNDPSESSYYQNSGPNLEQMQQKLQSYLARAGSPGSPDSRVEVLNMWSEGRTTNVRMRANLRIPLLSRWLGEYLTAVVESSAQRE
ncbi:hypothetical protein BSR29_02315 [Boudabousia liubingyangii]|uniref:Uncharacterized protein n=1 Tax=Boudabousia liubingyangii TaxID=1921764 RepID=A0A1Q5PQN1_9ACTO|nr:hypothetical protein [Boudabousia liubingyangii]OKL49803.1 hypothetical protein BSR29_02315 [Boudabousia liubingyangii]